jgi:hypothetical protein
VVTHSDIIYEDERLVRIPIESEELLIHTTAHSVDLLGYDCEKDRSYGPQAGLVIDSTNWFLDLSSFRFFDGDSMAEKFGSYREWMNAVGWNSSNNVYGADTRYLHIKDWFAKLLGKEKISHVRFRMILYWFVRERLKAYLRQSGKSIAEVVNAGFGFATHQIETITVEWHHTCEVLLRMGYRAIDNCGVEGMIYQYVRYPMAYFSYSTGYRQNTLYVVLPPGLLAINFSVKFIFSVEEEEELEEEIPDEIEFPEFGDDIDWGDDDEFVEEDDEGEGELIDIPSGTPVEDRITVGYYEPVGSTTCARPYPTSGGAFSPPFILMDSKEAMLSWTPPSHLGMTEIIGATLYGGTIGHKYVWSTNPQKWKRGTDGTCPLWVWYIEYHYRYWITD